MTLLTVSEIRQRLVGGHYRLSDHALKRLVESNISADMIRQAGANAEIIEDYPEDKYSPSCLMLGFTDDRTPLHVQVSRLPNPDLKIITLYVPDPARWIDFRHRRHKP